MDKRTAQQPKVQQFESKGFHDPQAAAETSGNYYYSYDGKSELLGKKAGKLEGGKGRKRGKKNFLKSYTKFFGGKIFSAMRVAWQNKNSQFYLRIKNFEMWVVHIKNVGE